MEGIQNVAPTAFLLLFAILYFGIMLDTGLFDPLTSKIIQLAKGDPLKIIVGTAVLAGIIGFDGDGSTTMMIVVTAFLPLYKRLGISPSYIGLHRHYADWYYNTCPLGRACWSGSECVTS